jgi:putative lipoprotein
MQAKLVSIAIAAALLSACGGSDAPPAAKAPSGAQASAAAAAAAQPPKPKYDTAIHGDLRVAGLTELPQGFQLNVRLLDVSDPSQVPPVVEEILQQAPSLLPYRFALPYDASKINPEGRYAVVAALVIENVPLYSSPSPTPVLTHGHGNNIGIELVRGGAQADTQIAPTEKMKQDFEALERSIGGFKRVAGERINEDVTVGWDAFIASGQVRFAREQIDFGDAGSAAFKYAYKDGKPWVIVRVQRDRTTWLGWNAAGELILNEGDAGAVESAEAERLREQAAALYGVAGSRGG